MSTVDADVECPGTLVRETDLPAGHIELTTARLARVGDIEVRRLLPLRRRRSVGAWCFVDHYGPMSVDGVAGMQVPPHPHIGLQTVTWLIEGNVLHRDSLGSEQMIRPGQLNLMTAGHGIAHSEESPADHDPGLHGSPTVLVDGTDPFAAPGQRASMSCRLYDNGPGRLEGAPSVGRLRQAIAAQEREDRRARRTGSSGGAASGAPR